MKNTSQLLEKLESELLNPRDGRLYVPSKAEPLEILEDVLLEHLSPEKYELAIAMLMLALTWERFEGLTQGMTSAKAGMFEQSMSRRVYCWAKKTYENKKSEISSR